MCQNIQVACKNSPQSRSMTIVFVTQVAKRPANICLRKQLHCSALEIASCCPCSSSLTCCRVGYVTLFSFYQKYFLLIRALWDSSHTVVDKGLPYALDSLRTDGVFLQRGNVPDVLGCHATVRVVAEAGAEAGEVQQITYTVGNNETLFTISRVGTRLLTTHPCTSL